ncbi:hypothetical protein [Amycolatopsis rhizosphaerae]|uniref:hypothetical protein n=1 Tax=Amycolatopsis rhizosphaerae TaxID=2053003 RepID=UPI001643F916|nr:hypothetical protein [Amycolatopsis rhizosphaerae]
MLVDELGEPFGDALIGVTRRSLVDQRGPHVVVPYPGHEVLGRGRKDVPGVTQVVEVQAL